MALAVSAQAQTQASPQESTAENGANSMVVATREAPPFAMKNEDGEWHGLAIELWRNIAEGKGYDYRFVESDLAGMIDGLQDGRYDASVGALTITAEREELVDFTHPFYATGFGIVTRKSSPGWLNLFNNFFTLGFLKAVLALSALLMLVGVLFWLAERKHNTEEFPEGARGIGSGFWFSAVTMTTVGYGDKAPRSTAGKILALIWMFAAIIIISTFTGMIASSLTAGQISGAISGPDELDSVKVGSIEKSASDEWLSDQGVGFSHYPDVAAGLEAVDAGELDAFVYDAPLLRYSVKQMQLGNLRMLPGSFGRQDYGIALPAGSALREPIDIALLREIESRSWRDDLQKMLGKGD
ncbi:transporter substrate-binding domain-containing protein [Altererythrobacter endophyticus]|uniref:Transporter substrate-binding domain-containing protein n=2 Tax=Altericroceibacterium endophyticum TaxID=1808508 RepID=A0A6I4T940_9SPHN|nr:transporter substrate-binding domain-containing protein [Altericroceibacterium endophyticum]